MDENRAEQDEQSRMTAEEEGARDSLTPGAAEPSEAGPQAESGIDDRLDTRLDPLKAGATVEGLIVHMDEHGALVDVGTKSEGHLSAEDLAGGTTDDGKPLEVGDRISVFVVRTEDEEGNPVLSKKRADYERVWQRVIDAHEQGEVLSAMVTDRVKGGLVVDLGLRGFLPASHVQTRNVHALDRFVGRSLRVKVIEVDRARKRVVVSHKQAIEDERRRRRERTLASLEENKIYRGIVRRITDYGAFIDLGGVDGLLHVTEMSWTRINHPSDVVKVGAKIDVMVLRFDRERNRISLGLKQILPDPWEDIQSKLRVGTTVTGKVTRVVPFGAFVRLESGVEGICPNAELPGEKGQRAAEVLSPGQEIQAKIVNIRPAERRMTLSMRQVEQAKERAELKEYMRRQEDDSKVTIGDLFGSVLSEAAENGTAPAEEGTGDESGPAASGEAADSSGDLPAATTAVPTKDADEKPETAEGGDEVGSAEATGEAAPAASAEEADQPAAVAEGEPEEAATDEPAPGAETEAVLEGPGEEKTDPAEGSECSSSESPAELEPEKD